MKILILQPMMNKTEEEIKKLNDELRIRALQLFNGGDIAADKDIQFNGFLNNKQYVDEDDRSECTTCLIRGLSYLRDADRVIYYNNEQDGIMEELERWSSYWNIPINYVDKSELEDIDRVYRDVVKNY